MEWYRYDSGVTERISDDADYDPPPYEFSDLGIMMNPLGGGLNGYGSLAVNLEQVESNVIRAVLQEHNANLTHTTGWNILIRNNTRSGIVSQPSIAIITYRV